MGAHPATRLAGVGAPDPDRLRRLNQVLAVVDADDHALRARLLAAVAEETDPAEWRRRRQVADEAVAAAMEADDDATTVDVIMSTSFITLSPNGPTSTSNWPRRCWPSARPAPIR